MIELVNWLAAQPAMRKATIWVDEVSGDARITLTHGRWQKTVENTDLAVFLGIEAIDSAVAQSDTHAREIM